MKVIGIHKLQALICAFACLICAQSAQAAPECRTAALPDGTPAMFCKDKNGNWKQQPGTVAVAPVASTGAAVSLSADAKYHGIAVWQYPIKTRQRAPRGLTDLLVQGLQPQTQREEILVTLVMRIEGEMISGTIRGGSWQTDVPITGTRRNGICNISGTYQGNSVSYVGKCDESGFVGKMKSFAANGANAGGDFQLETVSFTDTSARDARRAELKAKCDGGSNSACVELDQLK